jgi:hypothetical protein
VDWRVFFCCCDAGSSAKLKPNARRLEITLPLDTESDNYQEMQDEQKRIKTLQLRCALPCHAMLCSLPACMPCHAMLCMCYKQQLSANHHGSNLQCLDSSLAVVIMFST